MIVQHDLRIRPRSRRVGQTVSPPRFSGLRELAEKRSVRPATATDTNKYVPFHHPRLALADLARRRAGGVVDRSWAAAGKGGERKTMARIL